MNGNHPKRRKDKYNPYTLTLQTADSIHCFRMDRVWLII